ncbi:ThiF family adenylyltransferase [Phytoactinopolyspora halotolerans]|uniref:THIF-type NAD/FAD binding fold domain-containing protein n=1 Tax=Phytoactinopolyspora halotolerans TaxID=1981512 RepID=A0A6L9SKJ2_9ACTN|nr:ThiF family adenylyltransferase [Phytoactinopolyspora halotolerans]NEE04610.1 hypothetical protein [Phytoactinopolyspora halotolerans]
MNETGLTEYQFRALGELDQLSSPDSVSVVECIEDDAALVVAVDLATDTFAKVDGGLPVESLERLYVQIPKEYPWVPPQALVDHHRWDDYPHVLQGTRLCLYLDPAAEWDPHGGMRGYLQRLWDWFADAIADRFDAATALFHPVGGVFHRTPGAPTVVVAEQLADLSDGFRISKLTMRQRSDHRLDVIAWERPGLQRPSDTFPGILVVLSDTMPRGGGHYLSDLAATIRAQDSRNQRKQFFNVVSKTARSLTRDQYLHVIMAVPNRHLTGEARFHLIGWRLPQPAVAKAVESARQRHRSDTPPADHEPSVEWTYIDDVRPNVSTRRDHVRPVSWFAARSVELWGCGALGSWIAEHLVRAGVESITLRDPSYVTSGLLVRQNFTELDVGRPKVDALADRLRAISSRANVTPVQSFAQTSLQEGTKSADVIVDCTVNTAVSAALDQSQAEGGLRTPVVQVATDNETASLGILTVTTGEPGVTTNGIDRALHDAAATDRSLRPYLAFWNPDDHPSLTPTIGCSVPTFHGSAADASAVASTTVTLASTALSRRISGGYLFATAHAPHDVPRCVAVPATGPPSSEQSPVHGTG